MKNDEQVELLNGEIWEKYLGTRRRFTVSEYYKMAEVGILKDDERVELIHGKIIKMSPIGNPHKACVDRLHEMLILIPDRKHIISGQNPVRLGEIEDPQPDFAILKYRKDFYKNQYTQPEDVMLIIEVSDTNFFRDRNVKLPLYANAGIPEYWIVDLKKERVLVFTKPVGKEYLEPKEFLPGDMVQSTSIPAISLPVSDILCL